MKHYIDEDPPDYINLLNTYKSKFDLSDEDISCLKQSFSPFIVKRGLSKLAIRRRINKYKKYGLQTSLSDVLGNSLEVRINGKMILHANFGGAVPESHRQLQNLFKKILWKQ